MENIDEKQQELFFRLSMHEQNIRQLQQQLRAVEESILELNSLDFGLDELLGSRGKEILAPLGRGIFVKTKVLSEDLIVDIGSKNLVKKNIPETKKIIKEQLEKLQEIRKQLEKKTDEISKEIEKMILEVQEKENSF